MKLIQQNFPIQLWVSARIIRLILLEGDRGKLINYTPRVWVSCLLSKYRKKDTPADHEFTDEEVARQAMSGQRTVMRSEILVHCECYCGYKWRDGNGAFASQEECLECGSFYWKVTWISR